MNVHFAAFHSSSYPPRAIFNVRYAKNLKKGVNGPPDDEVWLLRHTLLGAKKAAPLREDAARRKNLQLKRSDVSRHGEKYVLNI